MDWIRRWSIASRIFALQLIAVVVVAGTLTLVLWLSSRQDANQTATRVSMAVAATLAHDPAVVSGVQSPQATEQLQPVAIEEMRATGVDFVTIMDPTGTRFTHPDPAQIGKKYLGTIAPAQQGRSLTETYTGTLGPSVRAVVPVIDHRKVVGLVASGVTEKKVTSSIAARIPYVLGGAVLLVLVGTLAAMLARRFLSRVTGTMPPSELSTAVTYYQAVLHSVKEGLILTDDRRRVVLYNDEAADLLDLPPASGDLRPTPVTELDLPDEIAQLVVDGGRVTDQTYVAGRRLLVVNQEPATPAGGSRQTVGTLTMLRDRTEVQRLAGELESVRTLTAALQSQSHEYMNRLHTVLSLLELGRRDEAISMIEDQVEHSQSLADDILGAANQPAVAALLLGKVAQAAERGVDLQVAVDERLPDSLLSAVDLVTLVGNLVDNAIDAAAENPGSPWVRVELTADPDGGMLELTVADSGAGVDPAVSERIFDRGFSTKPSGPLGRGFGLALVQELLETHGGSIQLRPGPPTEFVARWPVAARAATS
ncbi:ATP-binding protein [Leifsonia sp. L25]|uniref:ATP-binding protein n=1 Tax=Leifsonia TaxID=110932 RepID=UPI003D66E7CE